jgi:hypothetical protein
MSKYFIPDINNSMRSFCDAKRLSVIFFIIEYLLVAITRKTYVLSITHILQISNTFINQTKYSLLCYCSVTSLLLICYKIHLSSMNIYNWILDNVIIVTDRSKHHLICPRQWSSTDGASNLQRITNGEWTEDEGIRIEPTTGHNRNCSYRFLWRLTKQRLTDLFKNPSLWGLLSHNLFE